MAHGRKCRQESPARAAGHRPASLVPYSSDVRAGTADQGVAAMRPGIRRRWRLACAAVVLTVTAGLTGVPAAHAEVQNPRQEWLRNATAGLFLHWGLFTAPLHKDCAQ